MLIYIQLLCNDNQNEFEKKFLMWYWHSMEFSISVITKWQKLFAYLTILVCINLISLLCLLFNQERAQNVGTQNVFWMISKITTHRLTLFHPQLMIKWHTMIFLFVIHQWMNGILFISIQNILIKFNQFFSDKRSFEKNLLSFQHINVLRSTT